MNGSERASKSKKKIRGGQRNKNEMREPMKAESRATRAGSLWSGTIVDPIFLDTDLH